MAEIDRTQDGVEPPLRGEAGWGNSPVAATSGALSGLGAPSELIPSMESGRDPESDVLSPKDGLDASPGDVSGEELIAELRWDVGITRFGEGPHAFQLEAVIRQKGDEVAEAFAGGDTAVASQAYEAWFEEALASGLSVEVLAHEINRVNRMIAQQAVSGSILIDGAGGIESVPVEAVGDTDIVIVAAYGEKITSSLDELFKTELQGGGDEKLRGMVEAFMVLVGEAEEKASQLSAEEDEVRRGAGRKLADVCMTARRLLANSEYPKAAGLYDRYANPPLSVGGSINRINIQAASTLTQMGFLTQEDLRGLGFHEVIANYGMRFLPPKDGVALSGKLAEALRAFKVEAHRRGLDAWLGYALDTESPHLTRGTLRLMEHFLPTFRDGELSRYEADLVVRSFAEPVSKDIAESLIWAAGWMCDWAAYGKYRLLGREGDALDDVRFKRADHATFGMMRTFADMGIGGFSKAIVEDARRRWSGGLQERAALTGMVASLATMVVAPVLVLKGVAAAGKVANVIKLMRAGRISAIQTGAKLAAQTVRMGVNAIIELTPMGDVKTLLVITKGMGCLAVRVPLRIAGKGEAAVGAFVRKVLTAATRRREAIQHSLTSVAERMTETFQGRVKIDWVDVSLTPVLAGNNGMQLGGLSIRLPHIVFMAADSGGRGGKAGGEAGRPGVPGATADSYKQKTVLLPREEDAIPNQPDGGTVSEPQRSADPHDTVLMSPQEVHEAMDRGGQKPLPAQNHAPHGGMKRDGPRRDKRIMISLDEIDAALARHGGESRPVPNHTPHGDEVVMRPLSGSPQGKISAKPRHAGEVLPGLRWSPETTALISEVGVSLGAPDADMGLYSMLKIFLHQVPGSLLPFRSAMEPRYLNIVGEIVANLDETAMKIGKALPDDNGALAQARFLVSLPVMDLTPESLARLPKHVDSWVPKPDQPMKRLTPEFREWRLGALNRIKRMLTKELQHVGPEAQAALRRTVEALDERISRVKQEVCFYDVASIELRPPAVKKTPAAVAVEPKQRPARPPDASGHGRKPDKPGALTVALQAIDDPRVAKAVRQAAEGRRRRAGVRAAAVATGGTALLAGAAAVIYDAATESEEEALENLSLTERTLKGVEKKIGSLEAATAGIRPDAGVGDIHVHGLIALGPQMVEAWTYSRFMQLRIARMREGKGVSVDDLERLLTENGISDASQRLRFYRLAKGYFERAARVEAKARAVWPAAATPAVNSSRSESVSTAIISSNTPSAPAVKSYVEREFGFTPVGRVDLIRRDVHLSAVFYDFNDFLRATSPHNDLWKKSEASFSAEERVRFNAIKRYAEHTGGVSFGSGKTIVRHFGDYDAIVLAHEEGHELDGIGPYFAPYENPWSALKLILLQVDPEGQRKQIDAFLDIVFEKNGIRSLHAEMIQYLRETGRLAAGNPFSRGSILYDPAEVQDIKAVFEERYADWPEMKAYALDTLMKKYETFFAEVDRVYRQLKEVDALFLKWKTGKGKEAEERTKQEMLAYYQPLIISYLATRGSDAWNTNLRAIIEADLSLRGQR